MTQTSDTMVLFNDQCPVCSFEINHYAAYARREGLAVLFNDQCPVCSFEINHYAAYARREGLAVQFDDLNGPKRAAWGIDADTAAQRLYVLRDGELTSGIPAFLVLWREMPRYRWLARIVGLPGIRQAACALYDHMLAPLIYRWHLRRKARGTSPAG